MIIDILVPAAGESVKEGDIARWFKEDGDFVEMDEPLVELETDKASLEIPAAAEGKLKIVVEEGETVDVGSVIGQIDTEASADASANVVEVPTDSVEDQADDDKEEIVETRKVDRAKNSTVHNLNMPSPAARKMLSENNLSAMDIVGSGKDGRITKADVIEFVDDIAKEEDVTSKIEAPKAAGMDTMIHALHRVEAPVPEKPSVPKTETGNIETTSGSRNVRSEKMSRMRRTIASRLVEAQQTQALLTTFNEVDVSAVKELRAKYKESFNKKYGINLGFMSFFTKACALALHEFPAVNSSVDGDTIIYHDYADIGIAVSTPKGLVVPVLRNAETLSFDKVELGIMALAKKGRSNALTLDDMSGGTFSITNGGVFGSMLSTPIVNFPQSAILGMHNIVDRPVVVDGEIKVRPIMYLALTYDHRVIDGSGAVSFLVRVKQYIEDPARLLLNI
ncbi:MAG: 2-oxoglutarate dehydrogenase complex dihydrolipoyllysine-residue succinyltransferase [Lentisphaeria bacterium]|nr:2-oxoglutarate dehydrogenase complex dihydrolipoyllysine-residue succinyltransferase [Lentisphaeria bacterium]NQZ71296.1 2-oxoglutarate dehydrogenase complex dihydrolipoyllysine-residue succinyltransferase [Lentisphaeria bacterium]